MVVRGGPTVLFNGNHTTFLVQFEVYLLECYLPKAQIAFAIRAHAVLILLKNTPAQMRLHSLCILRGVGVGGQRIFWGGLKIFFEGKVGGGKKFLKAGRGNANFFRCH